MFGSIRRSRHLIFYGTTFTFLFYFSSIASFLVICILYPGENFLETVQTSRCQRAGNLEITQGSVDILNDFYPLGIPVPPILNLKLRMKQKTGILLIFMTGLL